MIHFMYIVQANSTAVTQWKLVCMVEYISYRIRLPPGSCRRQLTIPTMPQ